MTFATFALILITTAGGIFVNSPNSNGPVSGRVTGIAVDPSDPSGNTAYRGDTTGNTIYVGTANGGVWK